MEQWLAAIDEELRTQTLAKQLRKRAGRQSLLPKLSCIEHRHKPASYQCDQCGADLVKIGEGVSERLEVEPAGLFVHAISSAIRLPPVRDR
ncbi:MAG: IS66 family transposase zinc-finger binding domain-containing protein [Pseudomonadota bacterium]|nr:IS66 family transposase zinc-finger binding domain-containing protein [Pseudomonadota bacterium]